MYYNRLSENQLKVQVDLQQTYEAYVNLKRRSAQYAGSVFWKTVRGHEYLIKSNKAQGTYKSLGPRSPETERLLESFASGKEAARERLQQMAASVDEIIGMARGVRINRVPAIVGATLRELDDQGLLGKNIMVIGTNALYAYESAVGVRFDAGLMATGDMDLLWDSRSKLKIVSLKGQRHSIEGVGVLSALRKVDKTFEPVEKSGFRAVNSSGFYVDLLKATPSPPWSATEPDKIAEGDLTPSWLEQVKWMLSSEKFSTTVIGLDGIPAPMVCPDPRAFAVYKAWLANQPDRDPLKRRRDLAQANAVIELVSNEMPHLKLDERAEQMFPDSVRRISKGGFQIAPTDNRT